MGGPINNQGLPTFIVYSDQRHFRLQVFMGSPRDMYPYMGYPRIAQKTLLEDQDPA